MKKIITDAKKLNYMSDVIDLRKEGALARQIIVELKEVIRKKKLNALSAPQIGYDKRIFCIKYGEDDIRTYCNPMITKVTGMQLSREKCSSIPGKEFIRIRHPEIEVVFQNPLGKAVSQKLTGGASYLFQHHIDHLDNLLLSDVGLEIDEQFDKASKEEQDEVIAMYLDAIDMKAKEAKKIVEDTPELKSLSDGIDFMQQVKEGKIQLGDKVTVSKKIDPENIEENIDGK
mgnify:CR=1 FL=1